MTRDRVIHSLRNGLGERVRLVLSARGIGRLARDAGIVARGLVRAPAVVLAMVAMLTVGLGLFAVVYTFVQKILVEPMPYRDPGDLYFVWRDYGPIFDVERGFVGGPDVADLQKSGGVIEAAAGLGRQIVTFTAREMDEPSEIAVMVISPNLFDLLGVAPALGRTFLPTEVGPDRPPTIVLTHALWNRLGADPAIVGKDVRLNGQAHTVIGVMPASFAFVRHVTVGEAQRADAFTTFNIHLSDANPNAGVYAGLIRARRGTASAQVAAAVDAVGRTVDARDFKARGLRLYPTGLKGDLVAGIRPALLALVSAGVFLLLVLMMNLASVLLARAADRARELAVSRALGASAAAIFRTTLLEGGALGLLGGIAGTLVAIWGTPTLVALAPLDLPRHERVAVDWTIAVVVVGIGVSLGLFAALTPAAWAARLSLSSLLTTSTVRGGGAHSRMRRGLVVVQVTLSLILLNAGLLVVRSFALLLRTDPGFRSEGILAVRVPMPAQLVPAMNDVLTLQQRVEQAFAAIPGVTGVSATSALPLTASAGQLRVRIPGAPGNTGNAEKDGQLVDVIATRAAYVEIMGMRLIEGRTFDRVRHEGMSEALIDRALARRFFPTGSPLGAKIPFEKQSLTIVGVVDQARLYTVHQDGRAQIFVRAEDWRFRTLTFVLRTARDPQLLAPDVRSSMRGIDDRLALAELRTMDRVVGDALRQQRTSAVLISSLQSARSSSWRWACSPSSRAP